MDSIDLVSIRRHLHAHPEIGLKEFKTAKYLSGLLASWGLDVTCNIGSTGVVASLLRGRKDRVVGLRADMDGLPLVESSGPSYRSRHRGVMHACGHDGHMAMLLGAAHAMAHDPGFKGNVHFIFQPAEENIGGARQMIQDGLFKRFPCDYLFALHNMPGIPTGQFASRNGAVMASIDVVKIKVKGKGGTGHSLNKPSTPSLWALK